MLIQQNNCVMPFKIDKKYSYKIYIYLAGLGSEIELIRWVIKYQILHEMQKLNLKYQVLLSQLNLRY